MTDVTRYSRFTPYTSVVIYSKMGDRNIGATWRYCMVPW